ncbi:MAG TPA: PPOX class F420-dependent oxidoreductase [Polyangiaceae bacterium]
MDIAQFDQNRYVNLATFRKTGAEVKTPVWFAAVGPKLYVYTAGKAGKAKRLHNSSRARFAPCDVRGKVQGEWRDTNARITADPALIGQVYAALKRKYGWQISLLSFFARVAGTIRDRVYIEVDFPG